MPSLRRLILPSLAAAVALTAPRMADAFCGFYVSGADQALYNNATMVVLMRDGTRTVLSMQNNYEGPPENFAMVVPVPVVLQQDDVRTLPRELFDRVDQLAAPRLVEYWEQDPCARPYDDDDEAMVEYAPPSPSVARERRPARDLGVKVEAQFEVGEYQIVILSAKDSRGLDTWLRQEKYAIPEGAEQVLRPYVADGMKFFVAKVDARKVKFSDGQAQLSPLRFHYDSDTFTLPVRLGLLNSKGDQDLIVHILAREVRYAVANYKNFAIPTNLDVSEETRDEFGPFYASLFDTVLAENGNAVITEYAWAAGSCDPCPAPTLTMAELTTLGADVLPTYERALRGRMPSDLAWSAPNEFVLTRLHARYSSESLGEDLVFRAAQPISGGREVTGADGKLERGAVASSYNNFQARYAIRHRWRGPVECADPVYGVWGGPWPDAEQRGRGLAVARDLAFVRRDANLEDYLTVPAAEADELLHGDTKAPKPQPVRGIPTGRRASSSSAGCAGCQGESRVPLALLSGGLFIGLARRRRRA